MTKGRRHESEIFNPSSVQNHGPSVPDMIYDWVRTKAFIETQFSSPADHQQYVKRGGKEVLSTEPPIDRNLLEITLSLGVLEINNASQGKDFHGNATTEYDARSTITNKRGNISGALMMIDHYPQLKATFENNPRLKALVDQARDIIKRS